MKCPKCGLETEPGKKFCGNCGVKLPFNKKLKPQQILFFGYLLFVIILTICIYVVFFSKNILPVHSENFGTKYIFWLGPPSIAMLISQFIYTIVIVILSIIGKGEWLRKEEPLSEEEKTAEKERELKTQKRTEKIVKVVLIYFAFIFVCLIILVIYLIWTGLHRS